MTNGPQGALEWTEAGWREFTGDTGECVSLEHFGASAAGPVLYRELGLTTERAAARSGIARTTSSEGQLTP